MLIRIAELKDVDQIATFQLNMAYESESTTLNYKTLQAGVAAIIADSNKGTYLVAENNSQLIGCLMITKEWSDWKNSWYWWIQSAYVEPNWRQQGIFTAMYNTVKKMAANDGACSVRLYVDKTNINAQSAYKKLGMTDSHYFIYEIQLSK